MPENKEKVKEIPAASGKVMVDLEICHQCGICEMVCSLYHEGACSPSLSRISLLRAPFTGDGLVEVCRQCDYPDCYFVCPVDAVVIDGETGARIIVEEKCTGCGKCAKACPFNEKGTILKYLAEKKVYLKCDLCRGRQGGPACVEACPWGAVTFFPRKRKKVK